MLNIIQGDLLELAEAGEFDIIVQGCNCFNTMGSGLAKQIKDRYPLAYEVDCETELGDYNKLGNYTVSWVSDGEHRFHIINAYTQYDFSRGTDVFNYIAFSLILQKLEHAYPGKRYGFPRIGSGLAGGDADTIAGMIDTFRFDIEQAGGTVTIVDYQP